MEGIIKERIKARVEEIGSSYHRIALKAGLDRSFISDLYKRDRKKSFSADYLPAIAQALDCDVGYLVGEQDTPKSAQTDLPVVGTVEAGVFRTASDKVARAPVAPDHRYDATHQVLYSVADDHAQAISVLEGYLITVLTPDGVEISPSSLRPGDIVLAAQDQGEASETTIRVVALHGAAIALRMPSDGPGAPGTPYSRIIGRLIAATQVF